MSDTRL